LVKFDLHFIKPSIEAYPTTPLKQDLLHAASTDQSASPDKLQGMLINGKLYKYQTKRLNSRKMQIPDGVQND